MRAAEVVGPYGWVWRALSTTQRGVCGGRGERGKGLLRVPRQRRAREEELVKFRGLPDDLFVRHGVHGLGV